MGMTRHRKSGQNFIIQTGKDIYDLKASIQWIGQDILVAIFGGEKPHIGAVAVAHPRRSLKNPDVNSATASVICFSGHKEDELAKASSEILAASLNTNVVVTAGMHWDNITKQGIKEVIQKTSMLVDLILENILKTS